MGLKKRLTAAGIIAAATVLTFAVAKSGMKISEKQEEPVFSSGRETIYLWYTDEMLTSYLTGAAVAYNENHDVRIVPVLEPALEYLENINRASLESDAPDLYILGHDSLEKAYLAGLADEVAFSGEGSMEGVSMENISTENFSMEEAYIEPSPGSATSAASPARYAFSRESCPSI